MNIGIQVAKRKKTQTVGLQRGLKRKSIPESNAEHGEEDGEEGATAAEKQKDPLRGKIREALPDEYLTRVMRW